MFPVFNQLLPFMTLVGLGYVCKRQGLLSGNVIGLVTKSVLYVFLPAVLLGKLSSTPFDNLMNEAFLSGYLVAALAVMTMGGLLGYFLFERRLANATFIGLSGSYGNIGFFGIPTLSLLIGEWASVPLAIILTIDLLVLVPVATLVLQWCEGKEQHAGDFTAVKSLRRALINPLILSIFLGLFLSFTQVTLPVAFTTWLFWLGAAAGPCAMFIVGTALYGRRIGKRPFDVIYMSALKICIYPLAVWLAMQGFGVQKDWMIVAVLGASMPCAAVLSVIAEEYKIMSVQASSAILLTTLISIFLLPFLVASSSL